MVRLLDLSRWQLSSFSAESVRLPQRFSVLLWQSIAPVLPNSSISAATYIRRAKYGMFGYIRRWLKWGLISPRASSMVERVMRELGRRLKKTAYGWSDKGAPKIARIILKRFTNAKAWEDYWQEKMNCAGNVVVNIGNYKCFSQNLGQ